MTDNKAAYPAGPHRTKIGYRLFSDAYFASCSCGWHASSCTDRERIAQLVREHEETAP